MFLIDDMWPETGFPHHNDGFDTNKHADFTCVWTTTGKFINKKQRLNDQVRTRSRVHHDDEVFQPRIMEKLIPSKLSPQLGGLFFFMFFWRFLSGLPITCLSRISRAIFRHLRITDYGLPRIADYLIDYLLWRKTQLSAVYPLLSTQY